MLKLFALAIVVGTVFGFAAGGSLRGLANTRLRWPALPIVAAGSQLVQPLVAPSVRPLVLTASLGAVGAWLWGNRAAPRPLRLALTLLAAGVAMNAAVIGANGGMPVSRQALLHAGLPSTMNVVDGHQYRHRLATSRTALRWFDDEIPVAPFRSVVSIGDLAMLSGIAVLVAAAARSDARRWALAEGALSEGSEGR
jgi:hypothetical protein